MYSGKFLEKIFVEKFKESKQFSAMGNYWEKGNQNEIDIVAVNDLEKRVVIAEVKINRDKINIARLEEKSKKLVAKLSGYDVEYIGLSLDDI